MYRRVEVRGEKTNKGTAIGNLFVYSGNNIIFEQLLMKDERG